MRITIPKNGVVFDALNPAKRPPWEQSGVEEILFDRDGGIAAARNPDFPMVGPRSHNIVGKKIVLGDPDQGPAGSPRLHFDGICFHGCEIVIRSAYLTLFQYCTFDQCVIRVDRGQRDTYPSAFSFQDCRFVHCPFIDLQVPRLTIQGGASTIERCGKVILGLVDPLDDIGGGIVEFGAESDSIPKGGRQHLVIGRGISCRIWYALFQNVTLAPGFRDFDVFTEYGDTREERTFVEFPLHCKVLRPPGTVGPSGPRIVPADRPVL